MFEKCLERKTQQRDSYFSGVASRNIHNKKQILGIEFPRYIFSSFIVVWFYLPQVLCLRTARSQADETGISSCPDLLLLASSSLPWSILDLVPKLQLSAGVDETLRHNGTLEEYLPSGII